LFIKQNTKENCVLFASNEQTANFIKFNIDRISASSNSIYDNFYVEDNFINIDDLESHIKTFKLIGFKSILIIIDSLQNCTTTNTQTKSVKQKIKESLLRVRKLCEEYNVVCFIVGQVTKNKLFSGHNEIQHIVDAHIHIQQENLKKKILYLKNRFGDLTAEVELSNNYKICYEQHTISKKSIYQYLILLKNVLYITWNIISRSILFIFPSKIENKTKSKKRKK
jgi:predicted ATP-dependent serine protease